MKDRNLEGSGPPSRFSRRRFLAPQRSDGDWFLDRAATCAGGPGNVPPSDKINMAFIGVGAQGLR